jgi:hypothetical protein
MTIMQPEPNHPLTGLRREGVVADIANIPASVNVYIGGDTTTLVPCAYLADYYPVVNDNVILIENQGDYIIIGSLSGLNQAKGGFGVVGVDTGPASQTDYTAVTVVCSLTIPVINDRWYAMNVKGTGTQVTNVGLAVVRMKIAGTEVGRAFTPTYGNVGTNSAISAAGTYLHHATSTANLLFEVSAESSAAALRFAASALQLSVWDMGLIRPPP